MIRNIPLNPSVERILCRAELWAKNLGYSYVSADCVLLAMLLEQKGLHATSLEIAGVSKDHIDRTIAHIVREGFKSQSISVDNSQSAPKVESVPDERTSTSKNPT